MSAFEAWVRVLVSAVVFGGMSAFTDQANVLNHPWLVVVLDLSCLLVAGGSCDGTPRRASARFREAVVSFSAWVGIFCLFMLVARQEPAWVLGFVVALFANRWCGISWMHAFRFGVLQPILLGLVAVTVMQFAFFARSATSFAIHSGAVAALPVVVLFLVDGLVGVARRKSVA